MNPSDATVLDGRYSRRRIAKGTAERPCNYRITADRHQWVVNRLKVKGPESKTPGKEVLAPLSFHPTIELAVRACRDRVLRDLWPKGGVDPLDVPEAVIRLLPRLKAVLDQALALIPTTPNQEDAP